MVVEFFGRNYHANLLGTSPTKSGKKRNYDTFDKWRKLTMVDKILEKIKPTTVLSFNNANGINFFQFSPTAYSLLAYFTPISIVDSLINCQQNENLR